MAIVKRNCRDIITIYGYYITAMNQSDCLISGTRFINVCINIYVSVHVPGGESPSPAVPTIATRWRKYTTHHVLQN